MIRQRDIGSLYYVKGSTANPAQSDATLRDAAENLLIAIGMGWDLNGCVENLRAALVADAEPDDDKPLGFRTNDVPDPYTEGPQSDAEPQETRNKQLPGPDSILHELGPRPDASALIKSADISEQVWQAICARADTSVGLIEAAELAEECASECLEDRKAPLSAYALRDFAKLLRARAANRREK